MSKKTKPGIDPHDKNYVPMYYADQPAALMLGPFVSKLTFGVEELDDGEFPRPVVTIAMPTSSLVQLVHDLKKSFDDPAFRKHSAELLMKAAKTISTGGKTTPQDDIIVLSKPRPSRKAIAGKGSAT